MASVSTTSPEAVRNVVSRTMLLSRYLRVASDAARGRIDQCPASSPSSRPKTEGRSNRGKQSQSTEPSRLTSAPEWQSEIRA
jgi:hypothetical protein